MPIVGNDRNIKMGTGFRNDPMYTQVKDFLKFNQTIANEAGGLDIIRDPIGSLSKASTNETLKNYFIENCCNPEEYKNDPDAMEDEIAMMEAQFDNDREAVLNEYTNLAAANPIMGMTFPIHKNILMNSIYDKGGIPKVVATQPKFVISLEKRFIVTPDGKKYDMFKEQHMITDAMDSSAAFHDVEMTLPERGDTNIIEAIGAGTSDHLSIRTYISAVQVPVKYKTGDKLPDGTTAAADATVDTWINVHIEFSPQYGELDRHAMETVDFTGLNVDADKTSDDIAGYMKDDRLHISAINGIIKKVKVSAIKDISNGLNDNCSVLWSVTSTPEEIPERVHINVPIAPEEVKDIGALYQVNQLTKVMSMIKLCLENYKDDHIRRNLSDSFDRLGAESKFSAVFDAKPREGYALDIAEYNYKTFMYIFDSYITDLLTVLNDPNVTIGIFGRQDLVRKISPTGHVFHSPSAIGPVQLDFNKTVTTTDNRVYQFMSSQKLNKADPKCSLDRDDLTIVLNPRNTERIIYRIYDYQMYASNEIRNNKQYTLPAIDAFERWKFVEYQPVQGRMRIKNPRGFENV